MLSSSLIVWATGEASATPVAGSCPTEMNGFTKADNWLWDYVMPRANPNTFKVVCAVMRATVGWHQEQAELKFDDFHELTGISSRGTLTRAIDEALEEGYITREKVGRSFAYSLKIVPVNSTEIVPEADDSVSKSYSKQSQNRTDNSTEMRPPDSRPKERKERNKKENNNTGVDVGVSQAVSVYENEIGTISPMISQMLIAAVDEFGSQYVVDAIQIAVRNNRRKWSYVSGILDNWRANGRHQSRASPGQPSSGEGFELEGSVDGYGGTY